MVEIFANIPERVKEQAKFWMDFSLNYPPLEALKMLKDYSNSCIDPEEKDFVDFYFNLRWEELKNESNSDQR